MLINSEHGIITKKTKILILILSLILITGLLSITVIQITPANKSARPIVIRVDDIQDFAFKDAQLFLLQEIANKNHPLSLAIIMGMFGEDSELRTAVRSAIDCGCEVGVHGWKHENLTGLSMPTQMGILFQAKTKTKDLLDVTPILLVPPMFGYDDNTITAMQHESFSIITTCTDYHEPTTISDITNIPATVELSTISDKIWRMKHIDIVKTEVEESFESYGYAAIVTHPQEFLSNGQLNQTRMSTFKSLIAELAETCQFTTFEDLYQRKLIEY